MIKSFVIIFKDGEDLSSSLFYEMRSKYVHFVVKYSHKKLFNMLK